MDGMLLLEGYKLKQAVYLNLQKHTIFITHSDYYTPVVMFDLLERYFGKKDFSEKYLQSNIQISLNNDKLMPTDYIVYSCLFGDGVIMLLQAAENNFLAAFYL